MTLPARITATTLPATTISAPLPATTLPAPTSPAPTSPATPITATTITAPLAATMLPATTLPVTTIPARIAAIDWPRVHAELDEHGHAVIPQLLTALECDDLVALYPRDDGFRGRVVMARHGFGRGEYRYFAYPLPPLVAELRAHLYPRLVALAERWTGALGHPRDYPPDHAAYLERNHAAGQTRPTPLLLAYAEGDHNNLHQDLYGEHVFPLQVATLLSEPGRDHTGGEFVITEQRPRMQSRVTVVPLRQGDAVVFAVHQRPVQGVRGTYRVQLRHGVSRVRSGRRHALGVIFHDAT
jgi:uncharacterized protein